jgi:hypothetical protein
METPLDNRVTAVTSKIVTPPVEYNVEMERPDHSIVAFWTAGDARANVAVMRLLDETEGVVQVNVEHSDLESFCLAYLDFRGYEVHRRKVDVAEAIRATHGKDNETAPQLAPA